MPACLCAFGQLVCSPGCDEGTLRGGPDGGWSRGGQKDEKTTRDAVVALVASRASNWPRRPQRLARAIHRATNKLPRTGSVFASKWLLFARWPHRSPPASPGAPMRSASTQSANQFLGPRPQGLLLQRPPHRAHPRVGQATMRMTGRLQLRNRRERRSVVSPAAVLQRSGRAMQEKRSRSSGWSLPEYHVCSAVYMGVGNCEVRTRGSCERVPGEVGTCYGSSPIP